MGKAIKFIAWLLGGLVFLIGTTMALAMFFLDANLVKEQVGTMVKEQTGRDLMIGGQIGVSVFPWVGVNLNEVSLSNLPGQKGDPLVSVQTADVRIKLIPLLQKRMEVDRLHLTGLNLNLTRDASGHGNWEGLAGKEPPSATEKPTGKEKPPTAPTTPTSAASALPLLTLAGLELEHTKLHWKDAVTGQEITLSELGLKTGPVAPGQPMDLDLTFDYASGKPKITGNVGFSGHVALEGEGKKLAITKARMAIKAMGEGLPREGAEVTLLTDLMADLVASNLAIQSLTFQGKMGGSDQKTEVEITSTGEAKWQEGNYRLTGTKLLLKQYGKDLPGGLAQVRLISNFQADLNKQTASLSGFQATFQDKYDLRGSLEGTRILDAPQMTGSLRMEAFNPRELLASLGVTIPNADPALLTKAAFSSDIKASEKSLDLSSLDFTLDATRVQGKLGLKDWKKPGISFDLAINELDLDRYLGTGGKGKSQDSPPATTEAKNAPMAKEETTKAPESPKKGSGGGGEKKAAPSQGGQGAPLPVEALRTLDLAGHVKIGRLKNAGLTLTDLEGSLAAKEGLIRLDPFSAKLYDGSVKGSLTADARGRNLKVAFKNKLQGVQAKPLVADASGKEFVRGVLNLDLDVSTEAAHANDFLANLGGTSHFNVADGAVLGIHLEQTILEVRALIRKEPPPPSTGPKETPFSRLSGSAHIAKGVVTNDDLQAESRVFVADGKGQADLVREQLDYTLQLQVAKTYKGAGDLEKIKGQKFPVPVSGPFSDITVDKGQVTVGLAKVVAGEKLEKELTNQLEKKLGSGKGKELGKALGDGLKGLLGR